MAFYKLDWTPGFFCAAVFIEADLLDPFGSFKITFIF